MRQIHEGAWPTDAGTEAPAATLPGVRIHSDAGHRHRSGPTILPPCSLTRRTGASRSTLRPADVVAQQHATPSSGRPRPDPHTVHRSAHPSA